MQEYSIDEDNVGIKKPAMLQVTAFPKAYRRPVSDGSMNGCIIFPTLKIKSAKHTPIMMRWKKECRHLDSMPMRYIMDPDPKTEKADDISTRTIEASSS